MRRLDEITRSLLTQAWASKAAALKTAGQKKTGSGNDRTTPGELMTGNTIQAGMPDRVSREPLGTDVAREGAKSAALGEKAFDGQGATLRLSAGIEPATNGQAAALPMSYENWRATAAVERGGPAIGLGDDEAARSAIPRAVRK